MDLQDQTLQCVDCGKDFVFSVAEQQFYDSKGFVNKPKRCEACRAAKKAAHGDRRGSGPREMFEVPCANCGETASVPFKPTGSRPVLCKKCFDEQRNGGGLAPQEPQQAEVSQEEVEEPMAA